MKLRNKKTGEIGYIEHTLTTTEPLTGETLLTVRYKDNLGITCYKDYATIQFFNEQWEDYTPKEPLIKDEKNRELVRAWSKLYDYDPIRIYKRGRYISLYKDGVRGYSSSVGIDLPCDALQQVEDDHYYTIIELCGEEEE